LVDVSWRYVRIAESWAFVVCDPCVHKIVDLVEAEADRQ
jgi:hypothetical protein